MTAKIPAFRLEDFQVEAKGEPDLLAIAVIEREDAGKGRSSACRCDPYCECNRDCQCDKQCRHCRCVGDCDCYHHVECRCEHCLCEGGF